MKKILITTIFAFSLIFAVAGCNNANEKPVANSLHDASKASLSYTLKSELYDAEVSLTGTLEASKKTYVSTKSPGRIAILHNDVGDSVAEGDLLGALSGDESLINLGTARLDEKNAQIVYSSQKKLLDEQVESAKKTLERAGTALEAAKRSSSDIKNTTDEQTNLAGKSVGQAETALEIAESVAQQRLKSLYDAAMSTIRGGVLASSNAHSYAESLLEINEKRTGSYHDKYGKYFGKLDSSTKRDAESSLKESYELYKQVEQNLDEVGDLNGDGEEYKAYMEDTLEMLESTLTMLNDVFVMLNYSISALDFPEASLQALRQEGLLYSQYIEEAILSTSGDTKKGAKGWLVTYGEILTQNDAEINVAQSQLLVAQQKVNEVEAGASQYVASSESQVSILEKDVEQARIAIIATESQKQNVLRQLERELNVVHGTAQLSQAVVANTQVTAPFDGIITAKFVEEGQVVAAGQPIYQLSNTEGFKIITDLPDIYISKLEIGLTAEIKVDGLNETYSATLTKIDPNVNPANHKLGIELTLEDLPTNAKIGQFARIILKLPEETAYFVPINFIHRDFEGPYVILDDEERHAVSTSIEKNGMMRIWWADIHENMVITR